MSEILIGSNPDSPRVVGSFTSKVIETKEDKEYEEAEDKARQLPKAQGYKILCAIPTVEKEYESGLIKAEETMTYEERLATVLFVVDLGPDCYTDKTRYPNGPWCKKGDFIVVRPNIGTRLIIHGKEFRVINEDNVELTVDDPRGIKRA